MSLVLLQVSFIPARYPVHHIRATVQPTNSTIHDQLRNYSCDPNDGDRCLDKVVAALNLGLVCPHVLQLDLDVSHRHPHSTRVSPVICDALTIVTKRVTDQVKEGGRPFKGAHVSVKIPHSSGSGLLAWRIKSTKMMILSNS